jgi:hypothetical protein
MAVLAAASCIVGNGCFSPRGGDMHPEGIVDISAVESVMVGQGFLVSGEAEMSVLDTNGGEL